MSTVTNMSGAVIDFPAAVHFMDDDLREDLHSSGEYESDQLFFTSYEKAHAAKYGKAWELSKSNPVW